MKFFRENRMGIKHISKEVGVGVGETFRQLGIGTNSYYSVVKDIK
jgi:hypothetical protein